MSKDAFLKLEILSHEMWDEKKGLGHTNNKKLHDRILKRLSGKVDELEEMIPKLRSEIEFLKDFYQLNK